MPFVSSLRTAAACLGFAMVLGALAFPVVAQQAPTATEPDERGPEESPAIDTVELVAGSDAKGSEHNGILARELGRQAVLLSARNELGLRTRDRSLREGNTRTDRPVAGRLLLDVQISFAKGGKASLELFRVEGRERASLLRATKAFKKSASETVDYQQLAVWCEELSRKEIAAAIRKAAGDTTARHFDSTAAPDGDVEKLLSRMSFTAQFAAVRQLHDRVSRAEASISDQAALARGYANLGVLSEVYWHPASLVFKGRALLYAQQLFASEAAKVAPDAKTLVTAHAALGYALAFSGVHRAAIGEFTEAKKAANLPVWAALASALCEFDMQRLGDVPLDSPEGELSRLCLVLMYEHDAVTPEDFDYEANTASQEFLTAAAVELPHCWRIRAAAGRRSYDGDDRQAFDAAWYRDITVTPGLAGPAAEVVKNHTDASFPADGELEARAALVKALRTADAHDRCEPSQAVLATLIEETTFLGAFEQAQMFTGGYDPDEAEKAVKEFREKILPIVEKHPLLPMLEEWLKLASGARLEFDVDKLHRAVDASAVTTSSFDLLDFGYREPAQGIAGKIHAAILAHADHTFRDLALMSTRYDIDATRPHVQKLYAISPHAPHAVAGMIRHDWATVRDKAADWERRYAADQSVTAMLASRYLAEKRPIDARRCFEAYLKLTTTRQWTSLWAYRHLAETYRAEGNIARWLATLEDFLRQEGAADQRGPVQVMIAHHYLREGDYEQALHFAESVDSYDTADSQIVVAQCREYQHQWLAAEKAFRSVAENDPYRPQVLLWHRYCVQTGYGNLSAARNAVLTFAQSLDEDAEAAESDPESLGGIGHFHLFENETALALKWLIRAVDAQKKQNADGIADPRDALYAALLAHDLEKKDVRDGQLAHIATVGDKFVIDGRERKEIVAIAAAFADSFAEKTPVLRTTDDLDALIADAPADERAALCYFAGRLLERQGETSSAQAYFRRAVAMPVSDASRALSAVLLRRRGDEPNDIAITPAKIESRMTGG
jgi:tetratricopeptide (TPR) repeat protein